MEWTQYVERLRHGGQIIQSLSLVTSEQARWRPDEDRWSLLEVVNHLHDEEREDFRPRIDVALHHPEEPYPRISPMDWVKARGYNQRELESSVRDFATERAVSLQYLASLQTPDWNARGSGQNGGRARLRAGDLLVSWVAHDLFHIRQMSVLQWEYLAAFSLPYMTGYAGDPRDLG